MTLEDFSHQFSLRLSGFLAEERFPVIQLLQDFLASFQPAGINHVIHHPDKKVIRKQPLSNGPAAGGDLEIVQATTNAPRNPHVVPVSGIL